MMARNVLKRPTFAASLLAMLLVYLAVLVSNKRILFAAHPNSSINSSIVHMIAATL